MIPHELLKWGRSFFGSERRWSSTPQSGGINNRVYLCGDDDKQAIVKLFSACDPSKPDRFKAETEFLAYSAICAEEYVPRIVHVDPVKRLLVLEYLKGSRYSETLTPTAPDIQRAADYLKRLCLDTDLAKEHISQQAAEGFLSLSGHLENVSTRVAEMATAHAPQDLQGQALDLIGVLKERFARVEQETRKQIESGQIEDRIHVELLCPSPSDFGFHNAMACSQGPVFYDFEFSGWDDPAKTVADFFLQPRIPISTQYMCLFEESVASIMPLDVLRTRIKHLGPILHLKWATIILAVLRPKRLKSLLDVNPAQSEGTLIQDRLDTATRYLQDGVFNGLR